jgi:hypothetical protein
LATVYEGYAGACPGTYDFSGSCMLLATSNVGYACRSVNRSLFLLAGMLKAFTKGDEGFAGL